MSEHSFMNTSGLKVMRITSLIGLIIITVFLFLLNMIDVYFTHISKLSINIIISIVIILLYIILFIIVIPLLTYHYYYDENEIHIRKGIITVETDMIPFYRIQNIEVIEGFIMRKYKLAHLHLSTAGGECNIELIAKKEAIYLKQMIQNRKHELYE